MNLIDNKRELDEAVSVLRLVYENSGFHIKAVTASTEEYNQLKAEEDVELRGAVLELIDIVLSGGAQ